MLFSDELLQTGDSLTFHLLVSFEHPDSIGLQIEASESIGCFSHLFDFLLFIKQLYINSSTQLIQEGPLHLPLSQMIRPPFFFYLLVNNPPKCPQNILPEQLPPIVLLSHLHLILQRFPLGSLFFLHPYLLQLGLPLRLLLTLLLLALLLLFPLLFLALLVLLDLLFFFVEFLEVLALLSPKLGPLLHLNKVLGAAFLKQLFVFGGYLLLLHLPLNLLLGLHLLLLLSFPALLVLLGLDFSLPGKNLACFVLGGGGIWLILVDWVGFVAQVVFLVLVEDVILILRLPQHSRLLICHTFNV